MNINKLADYLQTCKQYKRAFTVTIFSKKPTVESYIGF